MLSSQKIRAFQVSKLMESGKSLLLEISFFTLYFRRADLLCVCRGDQSVIIFISTKQICDQTCGGSFVQQLHEVAMIGTVGPPLPSVDVCLESVPDMEYDALASIPRGA
ncbi:hypothetical protein POM88_015021 [Heracleum sosnowskyi]|uniref:Uncharacterized protein n=1 Tax=Heracleum sosnowskyi TaxID=360622 RepID=A0AAD8IKJ1_9APIA|nr:hypothetical protein POM88_015021 [Heracleum sosnowskyi]